MSLMNDDAFKLEGPFASLDEARAHLRANDPMRSVDAQADDKTAAQTSPAGSQPAEPTPTKIAKPVKTGR